MTRPALRAALLVALATAALGCRQGGVVRVVGGEERTGPFVRPEAYAAYARGAVAESEGRLDVAVAAYEEAIERGGDALVYARLGAVLCKQGRGVAAREQLARGYDADPRAAVVFRERARCALRLEEYGEALRASEHAVQLDPDDREALEIRATALARSGRAAEATALRDEGASRGAGAGERPSIAATDVRPGTDVTVTLRAPRGELEAVDDALARGALDEASARASRLRLSRSALAARALAFGHVAFARDLAGRVAAADPRDGSARLIAAAGADLAGDDADLARALSSSEPAAAPSDLARLLFAEVLLRHEGATAAAAFVTNTLLQQRRDDALEERVRLRLVAATGPRVTGE